MSALLVIDMQNDFLDGGPMATEDSFEIISTINRIRDSFQTVIFTKDWHPNNHSSFKNFGGQYNPHCIQETVGAEIHQFVKTTDNDAFVYKGTFQKYEPYSAFYNAKDIGKQTNLNEIIKANNVNNLYICGIGFDGCIFATALDCIKFGYKCTIIEDAVSYFDKKNYENAKKFLESMNISFIKSSLLEKVQ